jgi:hypothetical protein
MDRLGMMVADIQSLRPSQETWAKNLDYVFGMLVDLGVIADRLLRRFVPEYVPSEARGSDPQGDAAATED